MARTLHNSRARRYRLETDREILTAQPNLDSVRAMSSATMAGGPQVTGTAYASFLAQLPFFAGVPPEDVATFADAVLVRQYRAGHDIVVQRQFGHAMFVLLQGAVVVTVETSDATALRVARLADPGDYFGEAALLGRGERTATVTAETDVLLLELEKHRFDLLCRRHRSVREHLDGVYHQRAIATYLSTHRYLGRLDDQARQQLGRGATLKMYQRGDAVTKRGDPADSILIIKDGVVKASRTNQAGGPVSILAYFNTQDVVGVSDVGKRDYDLDAVGQCEVIFLSSTAFAMAMSKFPDVASHFGKDDMSRHEAMSMAANKTVLGVVQKFLDAGVEVESLLVINLDRCVRCGNCVRACHTRHEYTRLDRRGPIFRRRAKMKEGKHEHVMLPSSCRHCRDPECMIGCPTGAIQRNPAGDVDINNNCIGCENCARKCPYGNITMRPLDEKDRPSPEITKRAIKCNLCRNYSYSNCVHECPRGAILRVDPLRYFEELALVMESEQREAIEWERAQAKNRGVLGTKQLVRRRSTWFIPASFAIGALMLLGVFAAVFASDAPMRGSSPVGLPLGIAAAACLVSAAFLGARKRMANAEIPGDDKKRIAPRKKLFPRGQLESWTQFHMMLGLVGFITACAHAGFQVTGVFTTLLLLVFAFEVITGAWGQRIYMTVPKTLTRLERHGLARLVEDLIDEEATQALAIDELAATLPAKLWRSARGRVEIAAGTIGDRFKPSYDPPAALALAKQKLGRLPDLTDDMRGTIERLLESRVRQLDVQAQLRLHRRLRRWLVWHVATASALLVLLAFHLVTALTLL
jgi:Fe-S-cluster-containing dehydrogenase component